MMQRNKPFKELKKTGLDFQDFVVRCESPVELLRKQLTTADP
jgi:hypothetical protein